MASTRRVQEKDVIARLADAGEAALHRLSDLPGGKALADAMVGVKDRLGDVAMRLRTLDPLERRVSSIEKRLNTLEKPRKATTRTAATRPKAAPTRSTAAQRKTS